jgi:DUF971 family protein
LNPTDIQIIGEEMAIKWDNGEESFVYLAKLRKACPCAGCKGEKDVMGNLYKGPDKPYKLSSFRIRSIQYIGGYAIQPIWEDGHSTGLFSFDYLRAVADYPENEYP